MVILVALVGNAVILIPVTIPGVGSLLTKIFVNVDAGTVTLISPVGFTAVVAPEPAVGKASIAKFTLTMLVVAILTEVLPLAVPSSADVKPSAVFTAPIRALTGATPITVAPLLITTL